MKLLKYNITALFLVGIMVLTGCKDDPTEPTVSELEQQLAALMNGGKSWVAGSSGIIKDGFDVTDQFTDFKLTVGNKTYNVANGLSHVWPTSGTWDFQNNNPNLILRDGATGIAVAFSGATLTLSFTADGSASGGKVRSVSGEYQFNLVSE